jgi:glutamate-ammonia-ligase adenylyltransferase
MRDMRERIARDKGSGGVWDIKMARGGLLDIEFIAQYKQLIYAHDAPEILRRNTVAALRALAEHGALEQSEASNLVNAATLYHDLTQVIRLCVEDAFSPDSAPEGLKALITRAGGASDFERLQARLAETETTVAGIFDALDK